MCIDEAVDLHDRGRLRSRIHKVRIAEIRDQPPARCHIVKLKAPFLPKASIKVASAFQAVA
jgi:hypothetical protein